MGHMMLPGKTTSCIWMLLFLLSAKTSHVSSEIFTQTPGKVEVMVGQPVILKCHIKGVASYSDGERIYCHSVSWLKVHPATGKMETISFDNANEIDEACEVTITSATQKDSGMYYCLVKPDRYALHGNGSSVIVTENLNVSVELIVSSLDNGSSTTLFICRAEGVTSSEVRIAWIVNGEEHSGLTESVWSEGKEMTQGLLWLSTWQSGAQCTCSVETRGQNISKSLQYIDSSLCSSYLLYGVSGSVLFAIAMAIFSAVIFCQSRKVRGKGRRAENRGPDHGNRGRYDIRSSEMEVQYATLDQIHLEQASRARVQ
ncbi:uncharacterized protein LOC121695544 isoform X2 [Alosa sapidissima]|uniref:uncharacterized protein LOC121695544 isoform X2 n=1 Tax=Alosa sapidissima TaxID=34773 RepID=UPI001C09C3A1|nr:uncharacterized protein LOC121695544 isoform X2 [Alosa sapidissima]